MLNPFPELLMYSLLGPFILRVVVGLIFIDLGFLKFRSEKERWLASFETLRLRPADLLLPIYALLQIVGGALLVIGLWTQVAALIFIISLSLLLTGAGTYAIDIPL